MCWTLLKTLIRLEPSLSAVRDQPNGTFVLSWSARYTYRITRQAYSPTVALYFHVWFLPSGNVFGATPVPCSYRLTSTLAFCVTERGVATRCVDWCAVGDSSFLACWCPPISHIYKVNIVNIVTQIITWWRTTKQAQRLVASSLAYWHTLSWKMKSDIYRSFLSFNNNDTHLEKKWYTHISMSR